MINSKSHRLIIMSSVRRVEVSEGGEFYSFLTCVFKQYIYVYIFLYMFLFLFNLFLSYSLLSRLHFTYTLQTSYKEKETSFCSIRTFRTYYFRLISLFYMIYYASTCRLRSTIAPFGERRDFHFSLPAL